MSNPPVDSLANLSLQPVLSRLARRRETTISQLGDLVRIAGVSADGFPRAPLEDSARAVADLLTEAGLEHVEVVPFGGAPPYVLADWCHAEGAPTVLIYGHHDVQPPGNPERWKSPPWEPVERGGRLYGRGVVDDKAGIMAHVAAMGAWLTATGGLPVNVRMLIEGEEEVGSPNLTAFLTAHQERLAADCLILTDTCNLDTGLPSLTVSLRGMVIADVTVSSLSGPLHSGIWGGAVPDPVQGLAKILARLSGDDGRAAIPGIAMPPTDPERHRDLPFDADHFKAQGGVLDGVPLSAGEAGAAYRATWDEPTVTVSAIDCVPLAESSNQILPAVTARVGVRLAPEQDPEACNRALVDFLQDDPPFGCRVEVTPHVAAGGWHTDPAGPYFEAAKRALAAGYGVDAALIGCGGSIPFVEPFAIAMGGVPALLLGVEDPPCRAHGENESLSLADFDKACKSAVHLYGEIGRIR